MADVLGRRVNVVAKDIEMIVVFHFENMYHRNAKQLYSFIIQFYLVFSHISQCENGDSRRELLKKFHCHIVITLSPMQK